MAEELRVLLLGLPAITAGGAPFALKRRGVRALLFYLACQPGPVGRAELLSLFYEDEPESEARQKLRVALSRLSGELPDPRSLRRDTDQVELDPAGVSCDARDFEAAYEEIKRASAQIPALSPFPQGLQRRMVEAAGLWRGEQFMAGADLGSSQGLDDWLAQTRARLGRMRQHLFELLANHAIASGAPDAGADWMRRALEYDPANDLLHQRLANLLERQGRPADALAHLQNARGAYEREGFAGLPPELEAALERLREAASKKTAETLFPASQRRILRLPFIGRQAEMESLRDAHRRRQPALILGEAGAGKSRLVEEFQASLNPSPRLLTCTARVFGSGMPFQPLIEMLRGQVAAEDWRRLERPWVSALALLLPELETILPGAAPSGEGEINQPMLFEALHQLCKSLAGDRELLIVLDEAQWYDESSLAAFAFLSGRDLFYNRAGMIVSARLEDQPPAFEAFLHQLAVSRSLKRISLAALNEDEAAEMVRQAFGREPPARLAASLLRDTGGNPLFLLETLRGLIDYSLDPLAIDPERLPLAGSIHEMMRERLQKISPAGQALLAQAAVIGGSFPARLLEKVSKRTPEEMAAALDELEKAHLVSSGGAQAPAGQYSFVHDKLREVLLLEMTPARRRLLHLRAAEAIRELPGGPPDSRAGLVAEHYEAAGEEGLAFENWLAAGNHAQRLSSVAEARAAYQQASRILKRLGAEIEDAGVLQLYGAWVDFCFDTADRETLSQAAEGMLNAGYRRQNVELIRGGYLGLAAAADLAEKPAEGLTLLEQALPFLQSAPAASAREWMAYHYRRGGFWAMLNRVPEMIADLSRALEPALVDPSDRRAVGMRAHCGYRLGTVLIYHGQLHKALEVLQGSLADSRAAMNHAGATRAMLAVGLAHFYLGRLAQAEEYNQIAQRMADVMQNPRLSGTLYAQIAALAALQGRFDESWKVSGLALELAAPGGYKRAAAQAYAARADVLYALGDEAGALELYRQSAESSQSVYTTLQSTIRIGAIRTRIGAIQTRRGETEEGLAAIERALETSRLHQLGLYQRIAEEARASALLDLGRLEEARAAAEELARRAEESGLALLGGRAGLVLGEAALRAGQAAEACQKGLEAARQGREMGCELAELGGLELALRAAPSAPSAGEARARRDAILARLDAQTQDPFLRPRFEKFQARLTIL